MARAGVVRRTDARFVVRWEVYYPPGEDDGMGTHTLHFTKLGALLSRFVWQ